MKFRPRELVETADVSRGEAGRKAFLKNCVGVLAVLVLLYFVLGIAASILAHTIPDSWEVEMFQLRLGVELDDELDDSESVERARKIFRRLVADGELRELDYRFFVLEMDLPNAVALPGGGVGVTRGLLDRVESETGLATVLGHELGHHQSRHCLERLGRALLLRGAVALLFGSDGGVVESSLDLAEMSYSRAQETEADDFGLRLVHRVYGRTEGALEFFEMVHAEFDRDSSPWRALGGSHPPTAERIARLRTLARELEAAGDGG